VFFLEDGALFGEGPGHMSLEALGTLSALAASPSNIVYITSRRSRVDMQHVIAALPSNIGFILECGSLIREVSSTKFHFWKTEQSQAWLDGIWNMTKHYRQRVEGSFIEQRDNSMVFRYDMALDYPAAIRFANDLAYQARAFRGRESYKIIHRDSAVHAEPDMNISMDFAAEHVINQPPENLNPEFVFVVGGVCGTNALFRWADGKQWELQLPPQHRIDDSQRHSGSFSFIYTVGMGLYVDDARYKLPMDRSLLNILSFLSRLPTPLWRPPQ
jgi:trehalose-6-phosphatase